MNLRALILEDDAQQRRDLRNLLEQEFGAEVLEKRSESEFRKDFEAIAEWKPELAILDVMVRWGGLSREERDLSKEQEVPREATKPETAGVRCAQMLRERLNATALTIILYSVLPKEDFLKAGIPEQTSAVVKETNFQNLLERIRALLAGQAGG